MVQEKAYNWLGFPYKPWFFTRVDDGSSQNLPPSEGPKASDVNPGWEFAGWGKAKKITDLQTQEITVQELGVRKENAHQLGEWSATAICGNDITSSCLYVSALTILAAGPYAPFALLIVACVLFLFRKVYAEVGSALPLNGGTYTVLLNTSNKKYAAIAAVLTLLSYIATAVISAGEAIHYLDYLDFRDFNIIWATVALLGIFAFLSILGIAESARVALVIFAFHMLTLTVLSVFALIYIFQDPALFIENFRFPDFTLTGFVKAIFLGFASAMLGISGFESSANFIEEQKPGVFPRTLRNMWIAVSIFNPLICFLCLGIFQMDEVMANKNHLLASMGSRAVAPWFKYVVSADAILVLSGAVLTSYVGVTGLARRMSLDRCLPQLFLRENKWRKTNHWIIMSFFALCTLIVIITKVDVGLLAGVYTLSFLSVMALFAIGNMLLKWTRARLPREVRASWVAVSFALFAVLVGLAGNFRPDYIRVFSMFFSIMTAVVGVMFLRVPILKLMLFISKNALKKMNRINRIFGKAIIHRIQEINSKGVVYFTKGDNLASLNKAALYVLSNEQTNNLHVIHVYSDESDIPPNLASDLRTIDKLYPQLKIDFLAVKGRFSPKMIEAIGQRLKIPKNYMFIGTPGDQFSHELSTLGGVRLII